MNARTTLAAAALLSIIAVSAAGHSARDGALSVRANDIVGLWSTQGLVGACDATPPFIPVGNTLLFQAGGTVVENPLFPPGGVPNVFGVPGTNQRGPGLGTWSYFPASRAYLVHLRFEWFVDGAYHGYQTVDRVLQLDDDGEQGTGPVQTTRYAADGSVIVKFCGEATSARL